MITKVTIKDSEAKDKRQKLVKYRMKASDLEIAEWRQRLKNSFPNTEVPPGISEIKQVELYTKWRPCVPCDYQDTICPKPDDKILDRIKLQKRQKAKSKLAAKKKGKEAKLSSKPKPNEKEPKRPDKDFGDDKPNSMTQRTSTENSRRNKNTIDTIAM